MSSVITCRFSTELILSLCFVELWVSSSYLFLNAHPIPMGSSQLGRHTWMGKLFIASQPQLRIVPNILIQSLCDHATYGTLGDIWVKFHVKMFPLRSARPWCRERYWKETSVWPCKWELGKTLYVSWPVLSSCPADQICLDKMTCFRWQPMYPVIDCVAGVHIGDNHPSAGTNLIIWFLLLEPRDLLGVRGVVVFCKVGCCKGGHINSV